jgi:phospholipid N-methyltransferase
MGFLKEFIASPTAVGAIAPSSAGLARTIVEAAELDTASVVIEFGPGTGVFTERIVESVSADCVFFALEVNERLAETTRRRCPGTKVFHDTASNATKYLQAMGVSHCDRIVSGLPWAAFPRSLQRELLDTVRDILKPGGLFVTFAYLQGLLLPAGLRFRRILSERFAKVTTTRIVWRNLPPAFVYLAQARECSPRLERSN